MRDFTLSLYRQLIQNIISRNYTFQTFEQFIQSPADRVVIMRHDVDTWPSNALQIAKLESIYGVQATYYFRSLPISFDERIIKKIVALGHELGYHYEDLSSAKGDYERAFQAFRYNLDKFRNYYPVKTITMHGKPLSKWNNRDLWKRYNYRDLGILCEPYFDIDYKTVLYLTDTGGCWDGYNFNVRDTVNTGFNLQIHTTFDLIDTIENNKLPDRVIINTHPGRWNDNYIKWFYKKYVLTLPKRKIKSLIKKARS